MEEESSLQVLSIEESSYSNGTATISGAEPSKLESRYLSHVNFWSTAETNRQESLAKTLEIIPVSLAYEEDIEATFIAQVEQRPYPTQCTSTIDRDTCKDATKLNN